MGPSGPLIRSSPYLLDPPVFRVSRLPWLYSTLPSIHSNRKFNRYTWLCDFTIVAAVHPDVNTTAPLRKWTIGIQWEAGWPKMTAYIYIIRYTKVEKFNQKAGRFIICQIGLVLTTELLQVALLTRGEERACGGCNDTETIVWQVCFQFKIALSMTYDIRPLHALGGKYMWRLVRPSLYM